MINSILLQIQTVKSLALRQALIEIRKNPFGITGALIEPFLFMLGFIIIRLIVNNISVGFMNPVLLFGTGFVCMLMFIKVSLSSLDGVDKSRDLVLMPRVRLLDVILGRAIYQAQVKGTSMLLLILGLSLYEWKFIDASPGESFGLFMIIFLLAIGIGIAALILGKLLPFIKPIVNLVFRRVLFFTSAAFLPIADTPEFARPFLMWNPLLHGIELLRHSIIPEYPVPGISLTYLLAWTFGSIGFSLLAYQKNENLILAPESSEKEDKFAD